VADSPRGGAVRAAHPTTENLRGGPARAASRGAGLGARPDRGAAPAPAVLSPVVPNVRGIVAARALCAPRVTPPAPERPATMR